MNKKIEKPVQEEVESYLIQGIQVGIFSILKVDN